jgi:thiamine-monophosphate kinase
MVAADWCGANASDLIAKGAKPVAAFLALAWPKHRPEADLAAFAEGSGQIWPAFVPIVHCWVATQAQPQGPWFQVLTLLGQPLAGGGSPVLAVRRAQEMPWSLLVKLEKRVLVSKCAWARCPWQGLSLCASIAPSPPPLAFAELVAAHARGVDVSDGFLADAGHLATASGLQARLDLERIPLSITAQTWLNSVADPSNRKPFGCSSFSSVLLRSLFAHSARLPRGTRLLVCSLGCVLTCLFVSSFRDR